MNLIPATPGMTPSYWCTWGIQNYSITAASLGLPADDMRPFEGTTSFRLAMNNLDEQLLFEHPGWLSRSFPAARADLYVVFDVGWDIPRGTRYPEELWRFGAMQLDQARFPSCTGRPAERLRQLNEHVQACGWRGVGLWVAPQVPGDTHDGARATDAEAEQYWRERARWCHEAGIGYWKVDIGARSGSHAFRAMLSRVAHEEAPGLLVEHACNIGPFNDVAVPWDTIAASEQGRFHTWGHVLASSLELLAFSDVLRTYDVSVQLSAASTLDRVAQTLCHATTPSGALLNCEDEPYLAAALGCAFGVMRHPLWQERPGMAYNPTHLHHRIDEVTRAVRWQRLAPAFAAGTSSVALDTTVLMDRWRFAAGDTWADFVVGREIAQGAPARVARGMALPTVEADGDMPFVVASQFPNGALAVATLPRTLPDHGMTTPWATVSLEVGQTTQPIGVFGHYGALTLLLDAPLGTRRVWAQDLAGDEAEDITDMVMQNEARITLPAHVIERVGLSAATPGDMSEPGLVLAIR